MKVADVRKAVQAYHQLWWWSRLYYGEWARIKALAEIIALYSHAPQLELSVADEYKVTRLIAADSVFPALANLQNTIPFDLRVVVPQLESFGGSVLTRFSRLKMQFLELPEPIFAILNRYSMMTPPFMALIIQHADNLHPLYRLMNLLQQYNEFNIETFKLLFIRANALPLIDWWLNHYFSANFSNASQVGGNRYTVTHLLIAFTRADADVIDELALYQAQIGSRARRVISHDLFYQFLYRTVSVIHLHRKNDELFVKLNDKLISWAACAARDAKSEINIATILEYLAKGWEAGLVTDKMLSDLDRCLVLPTDFEEFSAVLKSVKTQFLSIDFVIQLRLKHSRLLFSELVKLFVELRENKIIFTADTLQRIANLNAKRLNEFKQLLEIARNFRVLTTDSIAAILDKVENRLGKVPVSSIRYIDHYDRDELKTDTASYQYIDPNFNLRQNDRALVGAYGTVDKLVKVDSYPLQFFAVKQMNVDRYGWVESKKIAEREARYNQFLGRYSAYHTDNDFKEVYVMMPWYEGIQLEHVLESVMLTLPVDVRLSMLIELLSVVKTLHQKYRAHGDIKPQNIIFDIVSRKLQLIDLNLAHREMSKRNYSFTDRYADPKRVTHHNQMKDDIYTLAPVFKKMFPEMSDNSENPVIYGIGNFVADLIECNADNRAVIGDVIQFMEYLHEHYKQLTKEAVLDQLKKIIYRSELTLEDILGGRIRVSYQ